MKKIFFAVIFISFSYSSYSQLSAISYKDETIADFYKSKTFAVLTGDKKFDSAIIKYMKEVWTITPYEFIKEKEFKSMELKKGCSYLLNLNIVVSKADGSFNKTYHYYGVLMGKDKKLSNYSYEEMISYCPIDFYGIENDQLSIYKRMPIILYNIQNSIFLVKQNQILGGTLKIVQELKKMYNENSGVLKSKILLVYKDRDKLLSQEDFGKKYPYKVEYCSLEKIQEAIENRDDRYAIYWPAITLNKSMFVFDASTYVPLFFDFQLQGLKITSGNISDLAESVKKSKFDKINESFFPLKSKNKETENTKIDSSKISVKTKSAITSTTSSPTNATPEVKTPPAEAPKPVYTPSSVSPGRKATDSELDFFNKLREQQPAAEPAK